MRPIEHRLYNVACDQFDGEEQQEDEQRGHPAIEDCHREKKRQQPCDRGTDIRDDTQQGGHSSPQCRVGNANEIQANAANDAEGCVHQELQEQITADAPGRILHRERRRPQAIQAHKAEDAIAKIRLFHEQERGEDQHDTHSCQR